MDSFELNKIMGAILGTCLGLLSLNIAANAIFHPVKPAKPGYEIVVPEKRRAATRRARRRSRIRRSSSFWRAPTWRAARPPTTNASPATPSTKAAATWSAPISTASSAARRAPWPASTIRPAFKKSMKGPWTAQEISDFVKNPKLMVPGTSMTFAGIPRASERADLILFLNSKSDKPQNLKAAQAK